MPGQKPPHHHDAAHHIKGNLWEADAEVDSDFETLKERLNYELDVIKKAVDISKKELPKNKHKRIDITAEEFSSQIREILLIIQELNWLTEKFGEGEYKDILGLCKLADRAEIAEKGYSLTPGAYVGVAPVADDGVDFTARMAEIHSELLALQIESNELMDTISKNMKEMGL
jgi:type I restriction enzyme M protein